MLDDLVRLRAHDPEAMEEKIREFPAQCLLAWERAGTLPLPVPAVPFRQVVIFGMGGSAIGADLVRALSEKDARVPLVVVRDYHAPAWVGPGTLAIGVSYSGTTEETLQALTAALAAGATPLALTTGGRLAELTRAAGGVVIPIAYQARPRAALAHLFLPLLRVLGRLGLVADRDGELRAAVAALQVRRATWLPETPTRRNEAKQLARWLARGLPVFVGSRHLVPVAWRWKGQLNENAKGWATVEMLPEMDHNAIVGLGLPRPVARQARVLFLSSPLLPERLRWREAATAALLTEAGVRHRRRAAAGQSLLADQLELVHLGDWVSYYLAALRGVDPTAMAPIDQLKAALAANEGR
ncbi:MAG: bifunctional phosphoglucose/phosphomannose isomerase [Chloroflexi bacterium]|nr:bifunctional phosphoglucose/phosphomannose isomerase [Chloroflexota bacterium]GIW10950.1 MAG: phosphate starvation-inducible protein PsiE [Dehalococcoidia bacterium]